VGYSQEYQDLINTYYKPILDFADVIINENGTLRHRTQPKSSFKFENRKYDEAAFGSDEPKYITPIIPTSDSHYREIAQSKELEIWNPVTNFRHASTIMAGQVLTKLERLDGDDDGDEQVPYHFFDRDNFDGTISYAFGRQEGSSSNDLKVVAEATGSENTDERTYLVWLACLRAIEYCYGNGVSANLREFTAKPEVHWKRLKRKYTEWTRDRKLISVELAEATETVYLSDDDLRAKKRPPGTLEFVDEEDMDEFMWKRYGKRDGVLYEDVSIYDAPKGEFDDIDLSGEKNKDETKAAETSFYDDLVLI
jgi:hypothetical protein